jgi:hypothetical protein
VGLAGLGVGVEEEVKAAGFLHRYSCQMLLCQRSYVILTDAATAMHLETRRPESAIRVVIMPNLEDLMKALRASTFSCKPGSSLFFALYLL